MSRLNYCNVFFRIRENNNKQKEALPSIIYDAQFYIATLIIVIEYINKKEIAHRDIKPENIMIENDSNLEPYLIDFGFSKIKQSDKQYTFTSSKCTPLYSPPENIYILMIVMQKK